MLQHKADGTSTSADAISLFPKTCFGILKIISNKGGGGGGGEVHPELLCFCFDLSFLRLGKVFVLRRCLLGIGVCSVCNGKLTQIIAHQVHSLGF
jgi:hypothetical protein